MYTVLYGNHPLKSEKKTTCYKSLCLNSNMLKLQERFPRKLRKVSIFLLTFLMQSAHGKTGHISRDFLPGTVEECLVSS